MGWGDTINTANNQIIGGGFSYDAAGNMLSDGIHNYSYDAEGNLATVDGGATATYTYDALNHRVRIDGSATGSEEFLYNVNGQRVSIWNPSTGVQIQGQAYWGAQPVEFYQPGGAAHFQHQDWEGTERVQTSYTGAVESTYISLPFGDGYSASGGDIDAYHFAGQDQDSSASDHARFREYSNMTGRWLSPDPYSGSYDPLNPQSMNRYAYVLGNPLTFTDALGLYLVCYETPDTGWDGGDNTVGVTAGSSVCDSVGYGPVGGGYGPNYGQIGGGGGAGASSGTSKGGLLHKIACGVFSALTSAASATNSTIGVGLGGSAGVGFILGIAASAGVQVVADSSGNLGVAINFGGNPGYGVFGAGAIGGGQVSYSTSGSIYGLGGGSIGAGVSAFIGELDGSVGSGGVVTGTVTAGAGVGTKSAALSLNYTFVPPALSTNCRQ